MHIDQIGEQTWALLGQQNKHDEQTTIKPRIRFIRKRSNLQTWKHQRPEIAKNVTTRLHTERN